ncbi:unnamed protein product [Macrosiphum euphorbiae]|uniref:Integrase catalytic domain-containing protein n=1 Tax=Macrosiphum euphorbiae TaxID=13131 RepID=A0AAV0WGX0_9HEMI|nr:unnamed protein product [Macrosiphum euphorbiae]
MAISDDVLVEPSVRSEPTGVNTARIQSRIQLPKIELPSFDARANSTVVLGTAIVHIKDAWGQTHAVRALLDSGSQLSAMTNNCSARLGLPRNRFQSNIVGLGQSPITQIQGVTRCQFTSHFDSKYVFPTVDMVVLPHITAAMPSAHVPSNVRHRYRHLLLADKQFDVPARIDVLFGADVFPNLIRSQAGVEHYAGFPSALDTKIVVGADTEEQLLRRKEAIVGLLHNGACELSKWTSNSALVLGSISPDHRANSVSFDPRDEHSVKVLGLHWNTTNDNFAYHTSIPQTSSTKRQVLSIIAHPASRGLLPRSTVASKIYWDGPDFLQLPEEQWPKSKFSPLSPDQLPETRPNVTTVLTVNVQSPSLELFSRFSSLSKLQRVLSFVLRFLRRLRRQSVNFGPLTLAEREAALFVVVQRTQQHHFSDLSNMLKTKSEVTPSSLAQLAPYTDVNGVIRVGGRLRFSDVHHEAKHPILLPRSSHLTDLLIRHYHLSFLHGGPKLIISMLSQKFWILSSRAAVRRVIFSCVPCTRHKAVRPQPTMADLPPFRVQPHRPFSHVGMDYGGPFLVREHRRRNAQAVKVYLALFVCMSVKAVHLEVVTDLTTDAFLAALDRFVARRGIPTNLYSDCGTNYVGAARQLKSLFRDAKAQDRLSSHLTCTWHFNPPAAPHFGGIWEAGIKSAKHHLKHVIGQQVLTYEEFHTLITRIEGILNSRPITPTSSDPHDLSALTPGHFLIGQPIHALPEPDTTNIRILRLNRWQLIKQCHQSYWKRWSREYLSTLQSRHKWFKQSPNLRIDDLVIVEAPSRPPTEWRLGRIIDVHPGSDEVVRVVSVRTQDGVFKRPVVKLVRLPIEP